MGGANENSAYFPARNPWNREARITGGSSGGTRPSAWTANATGTDTGGSVRQPAALTGVTGIKPAAWPLLGMIAFASASTRPVPWQAPKITPVLLQAASSFRAK